MNIAAKDLINSYQLQSHPEGGYYKETYRSEGTILRAALTPVFEGDRHFSTAIYFLLEQGDFSAFHKIKSDECWHFYAGETLHVHVLYADGRLELIKLGNDIFNGETFQAVVPAGCWFASVPTGKFSFVGCTVAPGFDFNDFEMADGEKLSEEFPQHTALIRKYCRD